jgi:disulfide oxidoreductase YuzD
MNIEKIQDAIEHALIKRLLEGDAFKIEYPDRIDISKDLKQAYANINYERLYALITQKLEEELATKIVNKIVTEMGTDIKRLMENATVREDFRFMLRKGVETILEKVKGT